MVCIFGTNCFIEEINGCLAFTVIYNPKNVAGKLLEEVSSSRLRGEAPVRYKFRHLVVSTK